MTTLSNPMQIETILSEDGYLSITLNGEVIGTVGEPAGPGDQSVFYIWTGTGLDSDDEEMEPISRIYTENHANVNDAWEEAVKKACRLILSNHFGG